MDRSSDPETWIACSNQKQRKNTSLLDRKLDQSSFFAIAALRKKKSVSREPPHTACVDPSASEEHGLEDSNDFNTIKYSTPARSLFSAHEEVVAAFSAGQRKLQQRMSVQQRRASIAEAQRERQAHMELLEQHFGRRFIRKAMTIVEENNDTNCLSDQIRKEEEKQGASGGQDVCAGEVPPAPEEIISSSSFDTTSMCPTYNDQKQQDYAMNIYAQTYNQNSSVFDPSVAATDDEEEESYFYIDFDADYYYSGSESFLQHTRFSMRARSSTDDLETVAAVF